MSAVQARGAGFVVKVYVLHDRREQGGLLGPVVRKCVARSHCYQSREAAAFCADLTAKQYARLMPDRIFEVRIEGGA